MTMGVIDTDFGRRRMCGNGVKIAVKKDWMYFQANSEDGNIQVRFGKYTPSSASSMRYSIDDGKTWNNLILYGSASDDYRYADIPVYVSKKTYVKGYSPNGLSAATAAGHQVTPTVIMLMYFTSFVITQSSVRCGGNVMSLLYGDDIDGKKTIPTKNCFMSLFVNCTKLTTPPKLPATVLKDGCYSQMFKGCKSLSYAPDLTATTLTPSCYYRMFYGDEALPRIRALFTTTPGNDYTDDWLYGVKSTGTFVKNSAATWNVTGVSGIPSGWTVITE